MLNEFQNQETNGAHLVEKLCSFMQAENFCLSVKKVAAGLYPAPDEFYERPLTPYFFIVHFNISLRHSGPSRCVTLRGILNKKKYCSQTQHFFNTCHPVLHVSVQRIIGHYFANIFKKS
jgi:hypothetical protein